MVNVTPSCPHESFEEWFHWDRKGIATYNNIMHFYANRKAIANCCQAAIQSP